MRNQSLIDISNLLDSMEGGVFMREYLDIVNSQVFDREARYVVMKMKDVEQYLSNQQKLELCNIVETIRRGRDAGGKQNLECVVVESDWKIYDDVWRMIETMELSK